MDNRYQVPGKQSCIKSTMLSKHGLCKPCPVNTNCLNLSVISLNQISYLLLQTISRVTEDDYCAFVIVVIGCLLRTSSWPTMSGTSTPTVDVPSSEK